MKNKLIVLASLAICAGAQAEWFQVKSTSSYNNVTVIRPDSPGNEISIRIKNLENIEDIQTDRTKVLFSGKSAQQLAQDVLRGQLVWIEREDLQEEGGTYVGSIYLSYEQVVRAFAKQRMVGGQTLSESVKKKVNNVARQMLSDLDSDQLFEDAGANIQAYNTARDGRQTYSYNSYYEDEYLRGIFAYETLNWFKKEGQFLPEQIQDRVLTWLGQYQSAEGQRAKILEMKIRDLTVRYELYKDFIFD